MKPDGSTAVLVVDDDTITCDLIVAMLAKSGLRAEAVTNGRAALDYLRSARRPPRLILLDLMMPEMTGWEFRKIQQGDPAIAGIPVAIITGMPADEVKGDKIGVVDVLAKPSRVEALSDLVKRFCN